MTGSELPQPPRRDKLFAALERFMPRVVTSRDVASIERLWRQTPHLRHVGLSVRGLGRASGRQQPGAESDDQAMDCPHPPRRG